MKRIVLRSILASIALASAVSAQEVLDGMAAVVNDDVITFSQVRELVGAQEKSARETMQGSLLQERIKEIRLKAINDLIDRQLILQEFRKQKFNIPTHFIEEQTQRVIREEFGGDRAAFIRTLAAQGYTLDRFRQLESEKMIVQAMRSQMIKTDVVVPEDKIRSYYREHASDFTQDEQVKLRMLTIRKPEGDSAPRRKLVDEIRRKIVEGAEFADLAKMYSEDSNQEQGGDWGWVNRRTLNESLTRIAFSQKVGAVSPVVELGGSYYLLFVEAKKNGNTKPLAEVRDEIQKRLVQEERQKRQDEWVGKLRKKAFIKIY